MSNKLLLTALLLGAMYLVLDYTNTERTILRADQVRVIDGDTIAIGDTTYRLMGYDTPETTFAKCDEERQLGDRATRRLAELIESARGIELDVRWKADKYDRKLARAYIFGQDVAYTMIAEGLARPYSGGKRGSWCDVQEVSLRGKEKAPSRLPVQRGLGLSARLEVRGDALQPEGWLQGTPLRNLARMTSPLSPAKSTPKGA